MDATCTLDHDVDMSALTRVWARFQAVLRSLSAAKPLRDLLYLKNDELRLGNKLLVNTNALLAEAKHLRESQASIARAVQSTNTLHATHAPYSERLLKTVLTTLLDMELRALLESPRYVEPKRLNRYEFHAYSQSGEDGIIQEIFRRIGISNRFFVEFGASNGLENNSALLLVKGWSGLWIEADIECVDAIGHKFSCQLQSAQLAVRQAFITAENIEELLGDARVPNEFDLLSIDIDGNDYWVWKAITRYKPRAVVIEYNATFRDDIDWIMNYDPKATWDGSSYQGASLRALEKLGHSKGYRLVGCSLSGVNAFFVRDDLVGDLFLEPHTAQTHYEPARYYFIYRQSGHPPGFGQFSTDEPESL